jgi:hypothetical protein
MLFCTRTAWVRNLACSFYVCAALTMAVICSNAASLPVFATVFAQATNEIASIESNFDNSTEQKQQLATLVRVRSVILNPGVRDDQALATLVNLLGDNPDYTAALDEAANGARASVLGTYDLLGVRLGDLPPSTRATLARNRYQALGSDAAALANAEHAAGISAQLAPLGRKLEDIHRLAERAANTRPPRIRPNSVRAQVDNRPFKSAGDGRHSPNTFDVTAPDPLYREIFCRVVDGKRVITFTLPVVTSQVRYEISEGLAALTYTEDAFAADAVSVSATSGTFFVQSDRDEVYGEFTAIGPDFTVANGRFRVKLPRDLRN